jgi:hypothetical protein
VGGDTGRRRALGLKRRGRLGYDAADDRSLAFDHEDDDFVVDLRDRHEPRAPTERKDHATRHAVFDAEVRTPDCPRVWGCALAHHSARIPVVSTFEERRLARQQWPIRAFRLGDEPLVDDRDTSTPDERLAMVWTLTREQWLLSGRAYPDYTRADTPGTVVRNR